MSVHVKLSTTLRDRVAEYDPGEGLFLDLSDGTTVEDVAQRLGLPLDEIKIVMVNGRQADRQTCLRDGDRLALFPAVGGG